MSQTGDPKKKAELMGTLEGIYRDLENNVEVDSESDDAGDDTPHLKCLQNANSLPGTVSGLLNSLE